MKAIILAAGVGKRLGQYTNEPKCLLQIDGETLLRRYMRVLDAFNVRDIILVAGYKHEKLETEVKESGFGDRVKIVVNPDFEEGSILSLWHARKGLNDDVLIMDADVYFVEEILDMIFSSPKKDFFLLDTTSINDGEAVMVGFDGDRAVAQARGLKGNFTVLGEMVGFTRLSAAVADKMSSLLERKVEEGERNIGYEFLFSEMFDVCPISYVAVDGLKWVEIDFPEDVLTAQGLAAEKKEHHPMGLNIKRNILLNPGPATTTDSVKLSLVVPDICPREKDFSIIMEEVRRGLLEVVGADERYACVLFSGSGTAVMDATINSTIKPGKRVLIINNGAYGERMVKIAEAYGIGFLELSFRWTDPPDLLLLEKALIENKDVTHVAMVHHETSTGMLNPLEDVCAIAKRLGREVIIDAISSYAGIPIDVKRHEIDYIMSTSNKCIQGMAGLSFVIAKKEPLDKLSEIPPRSFYLNLYRQYRYWEEKREMTFTPPVQLVYALRQALKEYFEEGGGIFRHRRYSENWHTLTDGLRKLGFRFLLPEGLQSRILTTVYFPASPYFSFEKLHDMLYQRGFTIYPGKISKMDTFRIANMGAIDKGDVINFLNALEETLGQMGITMPMEALH